MKGFFSRSQLAQAKPPPSLIPKCGACGLYKTCKTPKQETGGRGRKGILIVGSYPSAKDDETGRLFSDESGRYLKTLLARSGVDLRRDCWLDNAFICHPGKSGATAQKVEYCQPNIIKRIKDLDPTVVILLGSEAVNSVIGWLWKSNTSGIKPWTGWQIPSQQLNAWVCPMHSTTYVTKENEANNPVPKLLFERQIKQAVSLAGSRPWKKIPDWRSEIEIITDTRKAARILDKMVEKGGPVAFDYEANMLKPEPDGFEIVSCSVSWRGRRTIAYPWHGEAIRATVALLRGKQPKIAANLKYEDRVTRRILRTGIRNWYFDTMLAAHAIDSRPNTKSLKFQSFVHLGMPSYNDHIEPFLRSNGTMSANRVRDIGLEDLLLYNGLDSLLEYKLAERQMEILNYPKPEFM